MAANVGDTVMTPTNRQATVVEVNESGRYDNVLVREHVPERWLMAWRQDQIKVQRRTSSLSDTGSR